MNILCVLYETFLNFISAIIKHDYRDYIIINGNKFEKICRNFTHIIMIMV